MRLIVFILLEPVQKVFHSIVVEPYWYGKVGPDEVRNAFPDSKVTNKKQETGY